MTFALTLNEVAKLQPCASRWEHAQSILPKRRKITARMARDAGCTFNDMVWLAEALSQGDKAVDRRLRHWMADCAARVLHVYERDNPGDMRVRNAIKAARDYADGLIDAAARDAALAAARDAARAATRAAAWAATRAAAWDAALAAARDAALAAARDAAFSTARDAALAATRAAAWDAEGAWQFDRLIAWLSDDEPTPLALPEPAKVAA